jgi:hypothetical protein
MDAGGPPEVDMLDLLAECRLRQNLEATLADTNPKGEKLKQAVDCAVTQLLIHKARVREKALCNQNIEKEGNATESSVELNTIPD